jgi:hypothetical protein
MVPAAFMNKQQAYAYQTRKQPQPWKQSNIPEQKKLNHKIEKQPKKQDPENPNRTGTPVKLFKSE